MVTVCHFFFLYFFTIILSVEPIFILEVETNEHEALLAVYKDMAVSTRSNNIICNATGIFCKRKISNGTTVLRVTRIVFKHRRLRGSISPEIGQLSELKELSLPYNHLVNQIPPQIAGCRKLEVLNLKSNRFSGTVPSELSSLVRLRILDLSSNKFSGDLNFLKYLRNLEKLSLANNMFAGKVPASLRSFRNLRFFNISNNSFLDSPSNKVAPKRYIFIELNSTAPYNGSTRGEPVDDHKDKNMMKRSVIRWISGLSIGALAVIIWGVTTCARMLFSKKNDFKPTIFSSKIKAKDLEFLENDGVGLLQIIGKGGCGEVYGAKLHKSKVKAIAIKKVIETPINAAELTEGDTKLLTQKMRQILAEIVTVSKIRHPNLLPLLAHVSCPSCHYLVYEYMKNGSLQDILQQVKDGSRELDWPTRHRIALAVATGLMYLHMMCTPRMVHRDLKPANILLDDGMEARITDFGLAKSIPEDDTQIKINNVSGTLGYMAPEYFDTMKFTNKCDMYSFGVLLAVLVTGKFPSDEFFRSTYEMGLVMWIRNVMTGEDPEQAIEPKLMGKGYEKQMLLVLEIACLCTLDNPKKRPNSRRARSMLATIKPLMCKLVKI